MSPSVWLALLIISFASIFYHDYGLTAFLSVLFLVLTNNSDVIIVALRTLPRDVS